MEHQLGFTRELQGQALLDTSGNVWLPFDLPHLRDTGKGWMPLSSRRMLRHPLRDGMRCAAASTDELHVINGMGVTLGDSIIGMNALAWLKARQPGVRIHLYRTRHAPAHVERLYPMASHIVDHLHYLPKPLAAIPHDAIDLSDFLFWPPFATQPMVDFFLQSLGVAPDEVPAAAKCNRWLAGLDLPSLPPLWAGRDYVLLCSEASTPLRSMPEAQALALVEQAWRRYRLPVLGFRPLSHERYTDVSAHSRHLEQYMAWVRDASVLVATDSSAVHVAAGFEVPTLAVFVSIDPVLRVRDYVHCHAIDARTALTSGLHCSDDAALLEEVRRIWHGVVSRADLPWPLARRR